MHRTTRIQLSGLNSHLLCALCGGYFVDATTIIECLHSFCKTCIVCYLESSKFCPMCDVQVHKTRPLLNIRPDQTLQDLVYKLVPGLFTNEMKKRREFYAKNPMPGTSQSSGCQQMSLPMSTLDKCAIFTKDDKISLCLQFSPNGKPVKDVKEKHRKDTRAVQLLWRRYLLCPSAFTVGYLKKFIRLKYDLAQYHQIDVFYADEPLTDLYTLADIAYLYTWRRTLPLRLFYSIYEKRSRSIKCTKTSKIDTNSSNKSCTSSSVTPSVISSATTYVTSAVTPAVTSEACAPVANNDVESTTSSTFANATEHVTINHSLSHVVTTSTTVTDGVPQRSSTSLPPLIQPPSVASTSGFLIDDAISADDDSPSGPSEALKKAMASLGLIHSVPVRLPISNQSRRLLANRKSDPHDDRVHVTDTARRKSDGLVGTKRQCVADSDDDAIKRRCDVMTPCVDDVFVKESTANETRNGIDTGNCTQRTDWRQSQPETTHQNEAAIQSRQTGQLNGNGSLSESDKSKSEMRRESDTCDVGDVTSGNGTTDMCTNAKEPASRPHASCHVIEQHGRESGQMSEQSNSQKPEDEQEVPLDLHRPKCVSVK